MAIAKLRKVSANIEHGVLIKKVALKSKRGILAKGRTIKFKPAMTGRVIKPSPIAPSVGMRRIQAAVASVMEKHH